MKHNKQNEPVDAVEYAHKAGRAIYDSYENAAAEPVGWSIRPDGVVVSDAYNIEITPEGDVFGRHGDLVKYLSDADLTGRRVNDTANFESHHLIPVEILEQNGIDENDGLAVVVDWQGHMRDIHGSGGLQQGLAFTDTDELKDYYVSAYNEMGARQWALKVEEFVEHHRQDFDRGISEMIEQTSPASHDRLTAQGRREESADATGDGVADALEDDNDPSVTDRI